MRQFLKTRICGLEPAMTVQVVEWLGTECHHEPSKALQREWINTDALGPGAPAAATSRHGVAAVKVRPDVVSTQAVTKSPISTR